MYLELWLKIIKKQIKYNIFMDKLRVKKIRIMHFRGIKEFENNLDFSDENFIFGLNSTNKSTIIKSLRLMMENGYKNKYDYTEQDFYIENGKRFDKFTIDVKINYPSNDPEGNPFVNFIGERWFRLEVINNAGDIETQIYSSLDGDIFVKDISRDWSWTKGVNLIYISPNYDLSKDVKGIVPIFKKANPNYEDNVTTFEKKSQNIINEKINELSDDNAVKKINEEFKFTDKYMNFDFDASLNLLNVRLKGNNEFYFYKDGEEIKHPGDGAKRFYSTNLSIKKAKISFEKIDNIILLEEPENNLHITKQKKLISYLREEIPNLQLFVTTHSPEVIRFNKGSHFTRMINNTSNDSIVEWNRNISPFERRDIADSLFYERVFLLEGATEMSFYNYLAEVNNDFREYIEINNIMMVNMRGAYSYLYIDYFNELGIDAFAKIDNDTTDKNEFHRVKSIITHLNEKKKTELTKEDINEGNLEEVINFLMKSKIKVSSHHESFEGDLNNFLSKFDIVGEYGPNKKNQFLLKEIENNSWFFLSFLTIAELKEASNDIFWFI